MTERLVAQRPVSTRLEPVARLRSFDHWFTCVTPSDLASRARTVWQCRPVPTLSRLLPTFSGDPRGRLPPASTRPLRRPGGGALPSPHDYVGLRGAPYCSCYSLP